MGRLAEARAIVTQLRTILVAPNDLSVFRNPEHRELLLSSLRLAPARRNEADLPSRTLIEAAPGAPQH